MEYNKMRELNVNELSFVNGGTDIDWGDVFVEGVEGAIGGGTTGVRFGSLGIITGAFLGAAYFSTVELIDQLDRQLQK